MKYVKDSYVESNVIVHNRDLNIHGALFGGTLVSHIDQIAAIAAFKHSRKPIVTISIDELTFKAPVPPGTILTLKAAVNRVFNSSMEIGVHVTGIHTYTKQEFSVCSAYLTFVAIDEAGKPTPVEPITPESDIETARFNRALIRREHRISLQKKLW